MREDQREDRQQPPSRTIADDLRAKIESGELAPGAKLPSERDLADQYGTARNTAREAVRILSDAGIVLTDHGRGSFVRPNAPLIRLGNDRYSPKYRESGLSPFLLECAKQGKTGRFEVLSINRVQPPPEVAERLDVDPKTKSVLRRENVFYADQDPVHRVTTYIPWPIAEGSGLLQEEVPHRYGIHGVLEDRHHVMTRIREEVSTRMPRPDETQALQLRPGVPVLDVWHTSIDQDGEPYELTRFVMRGDMTGLLYDVPVE
jgi:GntR family transcriptional regulator